VTPLEVLIAARAKVAQGWTQHAPGRDAEGNLVDIKIAVCWCAIGACYAVVPSDSQGVADIAMFELSKVVPGGLISVFNDAPGRTQAEVLEVFVRGIEKLSGAA
jgi:hypothetical protein